MSVIYQFTISENLVSNNARDLSATQRRKLFDCMGPLQRGDVGKRVYAVGGVFQVESSQQRDRRLANQPQREFRLP